MIQRILVAIGFGFSTTLPVMFCEKCQPPRTLEDAWPLIGTFLIGTYGAFKSSTTVLAPNRRILTDGERRELLGLPPKRPVQ